MPRFFFDVDDGRRLILDEDGTELEGPRAARSEAIAVLPAIAGEVMPDGDHHVLSASVRDERGRILFRAKLTLEAEWVGLRAV